VIQFEENIALDLDHFLTADNEGWDEDQQKSEWVVYFLGVEVGRIFGNYETPSQVITMGGFGAKAEGLIKRLWDSA
jgi:hypothetical protein